MTRRGLGSSGGRAVAKAEPNRNAIVRITDPARGWHDVDLNQLLGCCRRGAGLSGQRCYPKWVEGDADGEEG